MSAECVKVAVRVRPLITSEINRGRQMCFSLVPGEPQIRMSDTNKSFTYNYVFGPDVDQEEVYNSSVKGMLENIFKGYNITILAYGQTGSGKTHSMGTNYSNEAPESAGIIPRAVHDMFETMSLKEHDDWSFRVTVSFMELYNEQLYDLLGDKAKEDCIVDIRGDKTGLKVPGLTECEVKSSEDVLICLVHGSQGRVTKATAMNPQSSRSHAIFTITVYQYKKNDSNSATTSKFHLVDLAGSERSSENQATDTTFKEGVSINRVLLALGNVISNLVDNATFINYRDSKLTRLLQDSLGANTITLMIACVSPADTNSKETVSTLIYADRIRKIKNKPIVNRDPKAAEINRLNSLVKDLELALLEKGPAANCPPEHGDLVEKIRSLQKTIRDLTEKLSANLTDFVGMHERAELAEQSREKLGEGIVGLIEDIQEVMKETDVKVDHSKLKEIHEKLVKLQVHQKQSEAEMIHQISLEKIIPKKRESDATAGDDSLTELKLDEEHREHTLLQVERNEEVNKIKRELAINEQLLCTTLEQLEERNLELMISREKYENVTAEHNLALERLRQMELAPKISLEEHQKATSQYENLMAERDLALERLRQMEFAPKISLEEHRKATLQYENLMAERDLALERLRQMELAPKISLEEHRKATSQYENLMAERDLELERLRQMELAPKISLEEHRKILEEELEKCRKQCLEGQGARSSIGGRRKNSGKKTLASKSSSTITFFAESETENLETDESFNDDSRKDPDYSPRHKKGKSMPNVPQVTIIKTRKRLLESIDNKKGDCKTKRQNNYL